jgi:hypothetical protein
MILSTAACAASSFVWYSCTRWPPPVLTMTLYPPAACA